MGLTGQTGVHLKGPTDVAQYEVVGPLGTLVMSEQPTLSWRPISDVPAPDAVAFFVTITDLDTGQKQRSGPITSMHWSAREPLQPGHRYRWSVVAHLSDGQETHAPFPPAPEARFKVLDRDKAAALRRLVGSGGSLSPYVRGMLYAQEGLIDDAEREFERLVDLNPRSAVAKKLLRNVRSLRTRAIDSVNDQTVPQ